jgi:hypothetical protein
MDWSQVLTILGGNMALFLWATRQARADFLHLDRKLDENRKETTQIVKAIQEEVRDFHSRMYCSEEKERK